MAWPHSETMGIELCQPHEATPLVALSNCSDFSTHSFAAAAAATAGDTAQAGRADWHLTVSLLPKLKIFLFLRSFTHSISFQVPRSRDSFALLNSSARNYSFSFSALFFFAISVLIHFSARFAVCDLRNSSVVELSVSGCKTVKAIETNSEHESATIPIDPIRSDRTEQRGTNHKYKIKLSIS